LCTVSHWKHPFSRQPTRSICCFGLNCTPEGNERC
jgi:hypothetical protein